MNEQLGDTQSGLAASDPSSRAPRLGRPLTVVLGAVSLLQVLTYALDMRGALEAFGLALGVVGSVLAVRAWRARSASALLALATAAVVGAIVFVLFIDAAPLPFHNRALLVILLSLYMAALVLMAGQAFLRIKARKIVRLAVWSAIGLLVVEAVASRRLAVYARTSGAGAQSIVEPSYVIRYRGPQEQDPEMGQVPVPNSVTEMMYPDDPRGYFHTRDGSWLLSVQPSSQAELVATADGVTVHIEQADDPTPWHIQLAHLGLHLKGGEEYSIHFRVRAARDRSYGFAATMAHEPWESLGLYETADVGPTWASVERTFVATASDDSARVILDLGADTSDVELSDLEVTRSEDGSRVEGGSKIEHYVAYEWNSQGCRAPEYPIPAPAGTFRIVVLGDDYTMGQGVHFQDVFTSVMERLLGERASAAGDARHFDVIGCGVSGFSTREERLYYRDRASAYQPDLVLLVMNDSDDYSFQDEVELGFVHTPAKWEYLLHVGYLVQERRHRAPDPDFRHSMDELTGLHQLVQDDGAVLGVVIFRTGVGSTWDRLSQSADSTAARLGVSVLDLDDALLFDDPATLLHEVVPRPDLTVHPLDGHPNDIAHRIVAQRIVDWLSAAGLIAPDAGRISVRDGRTGGAKAR